MSNKKTPRPPQEPPSSARPSSASSSRDSLTKRDSGTIHDDHSWRREMNPERHEDPRRENKSYASSYDKRIRQSKIQAAREKKIRQEQRAAAIIAHRQAAYDRTSILVEGLQAQLEEVRRLRAEYETGKRASPAPSTKAPKQRQGPPAQTVGFSRQRAAGDVEEGASGGTCEGTLGCVGTSGRVEAAASSRPVMSATSPRPDDERAPRPASAMSPRPASATCHRPTCTTSHRPTSHGPTPTRSPRSVPLGSFYVADDR